MLSTAENSNKEYSILNQEEKMMLDRIPQEARQTILRFLEIGDFRGAKEVYDYFIK